MAAASAALFTALSEADPVAGLSAYAHGCVTPPYPASVAPSAAFLAALGLPAQDTSLSVRDALHKALSTRLASLSREDCALFVAQLAARLPVSGGDSRSAAALLFSEGLQRLAALGGGAPALGAALRARPETLANVAPEVVMTLSPACRQLLWAAVPARCAADLAHALALFDRQVLVTSELPYNLMSMCKGGGGSGAGGAPAGAAGAAKAPASGGGGGGGGGVATGAPAAAAPAPADACRETRNRRRRSRAVQLLFHSVKGDPAAYATACALLQRRFEETADPKWCALRCDLLLLHFPSLPADPLAPLVLACEKLLNGGLGPEAVVREARAALAGAAAAAAAARPGASGAALRDALARAVGDTIKAAKAMKESFKRPPHLIKPGGKADGVWKGEGFCKPVVELFPALAATYPLKVKAPMDLRTMEVKAQAGLYGDADALRADMRLVVTNCRTFNADEPADSARSLFALVERVATTLDAELAKRLGAAAARAAAAGAPPPPGAPAPLHAHPLPPPQQPPPPHAVMQLLMALAEPALSRALVQRVHRGLAAACESGAPPAGDATLAHAVALLAAGDVAFAGPAGSHAPPPPPPGAPPHQQQQLEPEPDPRAQPLFPTATYQQLGAAAGELLAAPERSSGGEGAPSPLPLPFALLCGALQRLLMVCEVEGAGGGGGEAGALAAAAAGQTRALRDSLTVLQRAAPLHRRSVALLAAGAACYPSLVPALPAHRERLLALAALGVSPNGAVNPAVLVTLLQRACGAVTAPPRARPGGGGGGTGEAPLPPGAPAAALLRDVLLPALPRTSAVPHLRALAHYLLAEALRFLLERRAMGGEEAGAVLREALRALAPEPAHLAATASAWPRTLPALLEGGLVRPLALVWTRPDFDRARAAYVRLASAHFPGFSWAEWGLRGALVEPALSGDGGSQQGGNTHATSEPGDRGSVA
jgi:hypothetical protein